MSSATDGSGTKMKIFPSSFMARDRPGRPRGRPGLGAVSTLTVLGGTRCSLSGCRGDC